MKKFKWKWAVQKSIKGRNDWSIDFIHVTTSENTHTNTAAISEGTYICTAAIAETRKDVQELFDYITKHNSTTFPESLYNDLYEYRIMKIQIDTISAI